MPFLALATLILSAVFLEGCPRKDPPPVLSIICLGDGFGGADCSIPQGGTVPSGCSVKDPSKPTQVYCPPSSLKNYWMTTNPDMQNFSAWCYQTSVNDTAAALRLMQQGIQQSN